MRMRVLASVVSVVMAVVGCGGDKDDPGGGDGDGTDGTTEPDPKGWTIDVDMSATNRFVDPGTSPRWAIAGTATATEGIASATVGDTLVDVESDGLFSTEFSVAPGLTRVPVLVTDTAGHTRKGDRTLLAATFLPDTEHSPTAASIVLDDALLASLSGGIAGEAANVDLAGEILARDVLSQDDQCVTWPVDASQGQVTVGLVQDEGELWLHIQIPNLYVYFEGECQGPIRVIPLAGEMGGTVDIWTQLTPGAHAGPCLDAFDHTTPQVQVLGWGFNVWGLGGPLQNWIVSLFAGEKATEAKAQIQSEVTTRADTMLAEQLAHIAVFDRTSAVDLLGRPVAMHLCLGALNRVGNTLVARIAGQAHGDGTRVAPGAPQLESPMVAVPRNELVLDANLVGQLLFSAWKDGGLARPAPDTDLALLEAFVPALATRFPNATSAQVTIDAELPPLVTATPDGPGDVKVEIGDLMVDISVEGTRIFRFGLVLTLQLDLVPMDGKLAPQVLGTSAVVSLLDELYDGPDAALEGGVELQIGAAAEQLLGGGLALALPELPGLGAPMDVTADAGGRFLHVKLAN